MIATNPTGNLSESQFENGLSLSGNGLGCPKCNGGIGDINSDFSELDLSNLGDTSVPIDTNTTTDITSTSTISPYSITYPANGVSSSPSVYSQNASGQLTNVLTGAMADVTSILGRILPSGNVTYQTQAGLLTAPAGSLAANQLLSSATSSISSLLPFLLIGGVAILIMSSIGKK